MTTASHHYKCFQPTTISVEVVHWQLTRSVGMGQRGTRLVSSDVQALRGLRAGRKKLCAQQHWERLGAVPHLSKRCLSLEVGNGLARCHIFP